ncbi:hypothetical protein DTW90_31910 [Neorhizobium sp. P12A]|nr:hypothetical protein DTW90_31910 [Neorhizobium sp. P12A]
MASSFIGVLIAFIAPVFAGVAPTVAFQLLTAAIVTALFARALDVTLCPMILGILGALVFGISTSVFAQ